MTTTTTTIRIVDSDDHAIQLPGLATVVHSLLTYVQGNRDIQLSYVQLANRLICGDTSYPKHRHAWLDWLNQNDDDRASAFARSLNPIDLGVRADDILRIFGELRTVSVIKADNPSIQECVGQTNQIYVSQDWVDEIEATNHEPNSERDARIRLFAYAILLHEMAHLMMRHLFGALDTPPMKNQNRGKLDAGEVIEMSVFGFQLHAEWTAHESHPMRGFKLIAEDLASKSGPVDLTPHAIQVLVCAFDKIDQIPHVLADPSLVLPASAPPRGSTVRRRVHHFSPSSSIPQETEDISHNDLEETVEDCRQGGDSAHEDNGRIRRAVGCDQAKLRAMRHPSTIP